MESFFKVTERGSTWSREAVGGLTTFLAMAYIVAVNPAILAEAGVPIQAALTSTCLSAALLTIAMGLAANRPLALAPGMGINAVVAYSICLGHGVDWRVAMGVVVIEGLIILLLVLCGLRRAIIASIPADLRLAIGIGIGVFVAFIGLKGGGIVVEDASTLIALGDLSSPACIVSLVSIAVAVALHALRVPGALLISIAASTVISVLLGVSSMPTQWSFGLDFSAFAAPLQQDPATQLPALVRAATEPALLLISFSLLMSDFFDTVGGVMAVGRQAGFADAHGEVEDLQSILTVDSFGAVMGGFLGASSVTVYVESTLGAAAGARTGFSSMVVGALFAACAFCSPLVTMVSGSATCGALVVVGYLMMSSIGDIDWNRFEHAFPAFAIIAGIPFTYSITNGIGFGFVSYTVIMLVTRRAHEVKPLMWAAGLAFLVMFVFV